MHAYRHKLWSNELKRHPKEHKRNAKETKHVKKTDINKENKFKRKGFTVTHFIEEFNQKPLLVKHPHPQPNFRQTELKKILPHI